MVFLIGYGVALMGVLVALLLCKGAPKRTKYMIWGIVLMLVISPFFSFAVGLTYAAITSNGWAALIMWVMFPIGFVIGLIFFLIGIFQKKKVYGKLVL